MISATIQFYLYNTSNSHKANLHKPRTTFRGVFPHLEYTRIWSDLFISLYITEPLKVKGLAVAAWLY